MFKPIVIAIDYETALLDGTPSVDYFRPDFRVISCAFSWFDSEGNLKSRYEVGELRVGKMLRYIASNGIPVVVHNYQFEYGVTKHRFPFLSLTWHADTMRLVQVWDNGGKKAQKYHQERSLDEIIGTEDDEEVKVVTGLGLQVSAARVLPKEYHNHKEPYYEFIRSQGVKKGQEGSNLHLLPPEMLKAYNVADTEITLMLYKTLIEYFTSIKYDWGPDHFLYMFGAGLIAESKGRGIRVEREALAANVEAAEAEMADILAGFRERFQEHIEALEEVYMERIVAARSTEKSKLSARENALKTGSYKFNLNSGKQKADLFMGRLGIVPTFFTKKGAPAFGKAFLKQWGEGGVYLEKRGTLMIGLKQMKSLLAMSEYDGRYHVDLRAAGAATGRFKGGR